MDTEEEDKEKKSTYTYKPYTPPTLMESFSATLFNVAVILLRFGINVLYAVPLGFCTKLFWNSMIIVNFRSMEECTYNQAYLVSLVWLMVSSTLYSTVYNAMSNAVSAALYRLL